MQPNQYKKGLEIVFLCASKCQSGSDPLRGNEFAVTPYPQIAPRNNPCVNFRQFSQPKVWKLRSVTRVIIIILAFGTKSVHFN